MKATTSATLSGVKANGIPAVSYNSGRNRVLPSAIAARSASTAPAGSLRLLRQTWRAPSWAMPYSIMYNGATKIRLCWYQRATSPSGYTDQSIPTENRR